MAGMTSRVRNSVAEMTFSADAVNDQTVPFFQGLKKVDFDFTVSFSRRVYSYVFVSYDFTDFFSRFTRNIARYIDEFQNESILTIEVYYSLCGLI